jgi:hypothetical protein
LSSEERARRESHRTGNLVGGFLGGGLFGLVGAAIGNEIFLPLEEDQFGRASVQAPPPAAAPSRQAVLEPVQAGHPVRAYRPEIRDRRVTSVPAPEGRSALRSVEPVFYPGAGNAAPGAIDGLGVLPYHPPRGLQVVEYREPYIGRGLIYNVPPDPWLARSGHAIRAKY